MSFTSFSFLLFITAVFVLYFIVPLRWRWLVLLAASLFFYWCCSGLLIVSIVLSASSVFFAALSLERMSAESAVILKACGDRDAQAVLRRLFLRRKRWVLACVLLFNFLLLALTKYIPLFQRVANLAASFSGTKSPTFRQIAMPLGISFYTFQSAGYLIDVYRGKQEAQKSFLRVLLFLSFFPQIIQGPISRYHQLAPQLFEGHSFSFDRAKRGIIRIGWGFIKKLLLADRLSVLVTELFTNSQDYGGAIMFLAAILYGIQIYADFSSGIDIALGTAGVLGVEITPNFRQPYFATSLSDFWRRWHITLGAWMRDYLLYPVAMSKPLSRMNKNIRDRWGLRWSKVIIPGIVSFLVFIVVGIWHGPELKYIAYGLYNGAIIMLATMCEPFFERFFQRTKINRKGWLWHAFQILRTFLLVTVGRSIVRSLGVARALQSLTRLITDPRWSELGKIKTLGLAASDFVIIIFVLLLTAAVDVIAEYAEPPLDWLGKRHIVIRWIVYLLMIAMLLMLTPVSTIGGDFIYAKF